MKHKESEQLKQALFSHIKDSLSAKLKELDEYIKATKESRDSDTKSSAGDKFETSREMAQIELNNLEAQAAKISLQLNKLQQLPSKRTELISSGSFIKTSKGFYFISIPFGKIEMEGVTYFAISMASPFGQVLKGKKTGDVLSFNGNEIVIEEVW
jgi:hypothetical protein